MTDAGEQLDPAQLGHHEVGHDDVEVPALAQLERLVTSASGDDTCACTFEDRSHELS